MAEIEFDQVSKVFDNGHVAVDRLDLSLADGELLVLVGPSGCGKTTSLRMVAGLEDPTAGLIRIGGAVVNDVPPKRRDIAMVFQNYALYPHMTVAENMGFSLKLRKVAKAVIGERVRQAGTTLDLLDYLERRPKQLSGGQRQRVAMGRAIVREPRAFLMDEPLSNLDAKLRVQMRSEIARLQRRLGVTTLYVTHDQTEAMTMGDRVAVMRKGVLQQVAPPTVLYERPTNLFVAGFIGSPAMNVLEAVVDAPPGQAPAVRMGSLRLELGERLRQQAGGLADGRRVAVGIRPEDVEDAGLVHDAPEGRRVRLVVELVESLGAETIVHARTDATPVRTEELREIAADVDAGGAVHLDAAGSGALLLGRLNPRSTAAAGAPLDLVVDTDRLYLFDPETGAALVR